jgi:hypothetical protein
MKRITGILTFLMAAGLASGQNPQVIQNTRTMMQTVQNNATNASNQALGITSPARPAAAQPKTNAVPATVKPTSAAAKSPTITVHTGPAPAPVKAEAKPPAKTEKSKAAVKPAVQKKPAAAQAPAPKLATATAPAPAKNEVADNSGSDDDKDAPEKKWSMSGKRDPFVSPVVNHTGGSGCTTGKKCLEIGAINLRGVVRSDNGFIAVVTNSLNKAYFLRENDPVFDGYVVKITGDSITFKETLQDRLGKTFTREVVKKITTPVA